MKEWVVWLLLQNNVVNLVNVTVLWIAKLLKEYVFTCSYAEIIKYFR